MVKNPTRKCELCKNKTGMKNIWVEPALAGSTLVWIMGIVSYDFNSHKAFSKALTASLICWSSSSSLRICALHSRS